MAYVKCNLMVYSYLEMKAMRFGVKETARVKCGPVVGGSGVPAYLYLIDGSHVDSSPRSRPERNERMRYTGFDPDGDEI